MKFMTGIDTENFTRFSESIDEQHKSSCWLACAKVCWGNKSPPLYPISSFHFLHAQLLIELITDFRNSLIMDFTHQRENNIRKSRSMKRSYRYFKSVFVGVEVSPLSSTFVFSLNPTYCRAFGAVFPSFVIEPTKLYSLILIWLTRMKASIYFRLWRGASVEYVNRSHVHAFINP